jgi:nucleoside-diphosphate-sugar epimerase
MGVFVSRLTSALDGKEPMITWPKYKRLIGNLRCDDTKAVRELGFTRSSLTAMITDCYEWMKGEKLL